MSMYTAIDLQNAVTVKHAPQSVKNYCLHMYYFQGLTIPTLSKYFSKQQCTIRAWIKSFQSGEGLQRKAREIIRRKFSEKEIDWVLQLYREKPILYLDEAAVAFRSHFLKSMSRSHLHTILSEAGLTWKALERRLLFPIFSYAIFLYCYIL